MTFFTNRGTFDFSINVNTCNYSFAQQTSNTDTFFKNLLFPQLCIHFYQNCGQYRFPNTVALFHIFCTAHDFYSQQEDYQFALLQQQQLFLLSTIVRCTSMTFKYACIKLLVLLLLMFVGNIKTNTFFTQNNHLLVDQFAITNSLLFIFSVPSVLMFHPLPQTAKCRRQHPKTRTKSQLQTQLALAAAATLIILQPLILTNLAPRYLEIPNQPFHRPFLQSLKYLPIVN